VEQEVLNYISGTGDENLLKEFKEIYSKNDNINDNNKSSDVNDPTKNISTGKDNQNPFLMD
jgi:hypothetical protein